MLREMTPHYSFLEEVRNNAALDFSNLDKAFQKRIKKAQEVFLF